MIDINECAMSNGGCSQMCNNTNGSFVCSCTIGYMYMLADDSKTCSKELHVNEMRNYDTFFMHKSSMNV